MWGGTPPPPIPERILDGIPGFFAWMTLLFCIASAVAFPRVLLAIAAMVGLYSSVRFALAAYANVRGLGLIKQAEQQDWPQYYTENKTAQSLPLEDVWHIVLVPNYKEPLSLLRRTLDALAGAYRAKERMVIVLAMEAAEADCARKAELLQEEYADKFALLDYTVHPRGLPGEMQCKSANISWAIRTIHRRLQQRPGFEMDNVCVTTMDADTRWHDQYFEALSVKFALNPQRHVTFWQAPIRYHGKIWEINPLLRIVNAYATAIELAYLAAPWWRALPMSSYSLSLRLLHESGYWDRDVIADEWHMFIKAYFSQDGDVQLEQIMLPFIADASVGETLLDELRERYQQTLRHAWGSKEVGYMVAKMIDHPEMNFWSSLRWLIRIAHDILLAGAGWIILTAGSQLPVLLHPELAPLDIGRLLQSPQEEAIRALATVANDPVWLSIIFAGGLVVLLGAAFWLLDVLVRPPRTKPRTLPELLWTLLSFPLLPVLTLFVVALPTIQAQTRLLLGIPLQFRVTKKI